MLVVGVDMADGAAVADVVAEDAAAARHSQNGRSVRGAQYKNTRPAATS